MRLIDADKFIEFWEKASSIAEKIPGELGKMFRGLYAEVVEKIKEQPTIDAVPVVRCKDCKHCDPETGHCDHPMGTALPVARKPDDFCSYGEKREVTQNG